MELQGEVLDRAELFLGVELSESGRQTLSALCAVAAANLESRLRSGVSVDEIHEEFVTAAGVLALSMYAAVGGGDFSSVKVGEVTLTRGGGDFSDSLRTLAEEMLASQLTERGFDFRGVRG